MPIMIQYGTPYHRVRYVENTLKTNIMAITLNVTFQIKLQSFPINAPLN